MNRYLVTVALVGVYPGISRLVTKAFEAADVDEACELGLADAKGLFGADVIGVERCILAPLTEG